MLWLVTAAALAGGHLATFTANVVVSATFMPGLYQKKLGIMAGCNKQFEHHHVYLSDMVEE